jgi:hypothetical protein
MTQIRKEKQKKEKLKGVSEKLFRYLPLFLALILWCMLAFREQFFLKKVEDLSIFMFDKLFIMESFRIPGGFLGLAGSFLTQFLHLPWLGALIWVLLLLLAYYLTIRVLHIPESYRALALVPVALLVIGNMSVGYGIFIMREQDHFFAPTLGYIAALIPLFALNHIKSAWGRILMLLIWTAIGFPLLGTFAFIGTLAVSCAALTDKGLNRKERISVLLAGISLIMLIPLIEYNLFTSYRMADSWRQGLPTISEEVWNHAMRAPLQLSLLFIPVMAITVNRLKDNGGNIILQASLYIVAVASVWGFWFKDENFHTELAMSEAVDRFDWQRVIDIYSNVTDKHAKSDAKAYADRTQKLAGVNDQKLIDDILEQYGKRFFEPTRIMVLYRDLALLKMNRALDDAFTYKDGGRPQKSRTQIPISLQSGKQLYLQYGLVNMSYRWCLEDVIEHNWSYSTLKYLAMHCTIMQESEFAYKYMNKLRKTIFYRKWAGQQLVLSQDSSLMATSEPYNSILPYMCFEDRMSNDMVKSEVFIINHFLYNEPLHPTPEYDRAALLFAMRIQDIPRFRERLIYYVNSNDFRTLPRSVQEAAILYNDLEKKNIELPYNKEIQDSYNAFKRFVNANPVRSIKESAYPYSQKFGKTFFYYYYFVRNLQTY